MAVITVFYPNKPDASFDWDYYTSTHLALVGEKWATMGFQGARILKGSTGAEPGSDPSYVCMVIVDFESVEAFQAAAAAHGDEIFGDIPNFTNIEPIVQVSEALGG